MPGYTGKFLQIFVYHKYVTYRMVTGQVEEFRVKAGFTDPTLTDTPTVALWLYFEDLEYKTHEFLMGGPAMDIKFSMGKLFGAAKDSNLEVNGKLDLSALKFRKGSSVTAWKTLGATFPGTLSIPGQVIDLTTGPLILVRFRVVLGLKGRVDLVFEAIVLPEDQTMETLPLETRQTLEKSAARTFLLWKKAVAPYCPSSITGLLLTPGLCVKEGSDVPTDPVIRFALTGVIELSLKRNHFKSLEDFTKYMESPVLAKGERVKYQFVFKTAPNPLFTDISGEPSSILPSDKGSAKLVTIWGGKRKGLVIDLERRKRARKSLKLPEPTAPPKFSTTPYPSLKLSRLALPPETPREDYERAVGNFSASISQNTQAVYCTTAKHVESAEEKLGRKFSCPPTDQERLFFLTYLQGKSLKSDTVAQYMSAFRKECICQFIYL